jgi:hypothetical protein
MTGKIFISYRRNDSSAYAGRVHDRLELEFGTDQLFMDVEAIPLGIDFTKTLSEEVSKCDVLLAVIGENWLNARDEKGNRRLDNPDDLVRIEIATALKRDIPVIPVLVDGARIPTADELPEDLKGLSRRNGLDVHHASFQRDMNKLVQALKDILGDAGQLSSPIPVSAPAPAVLSNDQQPASAKIIFGTDHPFETVAVAGKNKNRTVRVKIENVTDAEISNGTVSILNLDPPQNDHGNFFLKDDITIGPRRHMFIDVAYYSEGTSEALPGPWIKLCVPIPAGFLFHTLPGTLPLVPHTFQLRFWSLEDRTLDEVYCRLFVDENHILHLENWGDSAKLPSPRSVPKPDISVLLNRDLKQLDDYQVVCAIDVENSGAVAELDSCLVEMTEFSGTVPAGMKIPATLRSAGQIQGNRSGRFKLSSGQRKPIPIFFASTRRKNEWFFIDERGGKYPLVAQPTRISLQIYGGKETQVARLFIDTDAGWTPHPRLETVTNL